jgi:hypothetical protein
MAVSGWSLPKYARTVWGIEAFLPESGLRAPAQQTDARPTRIVGDEGNIASKVDLAAVAA